MSAERPRACGAVHEGPCVGSTHVLPAPGPDKVFAVADPSCCATGHAYECGKCGHRWTATDLEFCDAIEEDRACPACGEEVATFAVPTNDAEAMLVAFQKAMFGKGGPLHG